jgi:hypothetical protein
LRTIGDFQRAWAAKADAPFGRWVPGTSADERRAQFRTLAALCAAFVGSGHQVVAELRAAEVDQAAADRALEIFNVLPALTRRRILSTWGGTMWPPRARRHDRLGGSGTHEGRS